VRHSGMILVLEKGDHAELVSHDGIYAGLLNESIIETI
jgi:ATP-binding cassette subfamily B multidrug efflux pump